MVIDIIIIIIIIIIINNDIIIIFIQYYSFAWLFIYWHIIRIIIYIIHINNFMAVCADPRAAILQGPCLSICRR